MEFARNEHLRAQVLRVPALDVHEHHMPEITSNRDADLLDLHGRSHAGGTEARPYPLLSQARHEDLMFAQGNAGTWDAIAAVADLTI